MSYSVVKRDNTFVIVDKQSDQDVITSKHEKDARKMCRTMNLGGAFAGRIPDFFLYTVKQGCS